MNDTERSADVSLDTDRLEQLLEVPAPAQPVVMIEYRNRGVPWWLLVSLVVLVPLVAVVAYQQLVVQTFQAQAANARYLAQKLETERTVGEGPKADVSPVQPVRRKRGSRRGYNRDLGPGGTCTSTTRGTDTRFARGYVRSEVAAGPAGRSG